MNEDHLEYLLGAIDLTMRSPGPLSDSPEGKDIKRTLAVIQKGIESNRERGNRIRVLREVSETPEGHHAEKVKNCKGEILSYIDWRNRHHKPWTGEGARPLRIYEHFVKRRGYDDDPEIVREALRELTGLPLPEIEEDVSC